MEPTLIEGGLAIDDRGELSFVNNFHFEGVKRFYMVSNHKQGFVRAWHGHKKEAKYVMVVAGAALIGVVNMDDDNANGKYILSAHKPAILHIPAGNYNGFMTLAPDTKLIFFSTSTLEESRGDDYRLPAKHWDFWNIEER